MRIVLSCVLLFPLLLHAGIDPELTKVLAQLLDKVPEWAREQDDQMATFLKWDVAVQQEEAAKGDDFVTEELQLVSTAFPHFFAKATPTLQYQRAAIPLALILLKTPDEWILCQFTVSNTFEAPTNRRLRMDQVVVWAWPVSTEAAWDKMRQEITHESAGLSIDAIVGTMVSQSLSFRDKRTGYTDFFGKVFRDSDGKREMLVKGTISRAWFRLSFEMPNWFTEGNKPREAPSMRPMTLEEAETRLREGGAKKMQLLRLQPMKDE